MPQPKNPDRDEPTKIDLPFEDAMRALLAVPRSSVDLTDAEVLDRVLTD